MGSVRSRLIALSVVLVMVTFAYPREVVGVGPIVLRVIAVDETQHAGVGDDHFMAELAQEPAGPERMSAGFEHESGR